MAQNTDVDMAAKKSNTKGGFDCEFVSSPAKGIQWECSVCLQILREPYQAPCCGNSFCKVCIERIKAANKPCPTCNEENFLTFHNKGLQRTLYELQVYCSHKKEGCEWIGTLGELEQHLNALPTSDQQLKGCEYSQLSSTDRVDTINGGKGIPSPDHTQSSSNSKTNNSVPESTNEQPQLPDPEANPPAANIIKAPPPALPHQQGSGIQQQGPVPPAPPPPQASTPKVQQEDPVQKVQPQQGNVNPPPVQQGNVNPPPVFRQNDYGNRGWMTFFFGMCAGFIVPVLLGVLIYFHIQADKCGLMQSLVQKCDHRCTSTYLWYECHCDPGYALSSNKWKCDDINECIEDTHNCTQQAQTCVNTQGSFTCECHDGYTRHIQPDTDKFTCEDINECNKGTHKCDQLCINTVGSYQCDCHSGYELSSDGFTCEDIDECAPEKKPCPQICRNTDGSYECDCYRGYTLESDQVNCRDINECTKGTHRCGQLCINTVGSYQCNCRSGYKLSSDGFTCEDIDECEKKPCPQICRNTVGSYECDCYRGYTLKSDQVNCRDDNECARQLYCTKDHANCNNTIGSYHCYCDPGYRIMKDGITCENIDECEEKIDKCEHFCADTEGSYSCRCRPGRFWLNDDGFSCDDWLDMLKANPDQNKPLWFQEIWNEGSSLDILMTGKTGSGKSTLVNGLVGSKVIDIKEHSLIRDTTKVTSYSATIHNVSIRIWDSPGLQDRTGKEQEYIKEMKEKCSSVDLVLYCIRMDESRLYNDDREAISALKNAFGKKFWDRTFFILTFANKVDPPQAKQDDIVGYFDERLMEFSTELHNLLTDLEITIKKEHFVKRMIPTGFEDLHLPGRRYWLSTLWHTVLSEADEHAQGAMLKIGLKRMIEEAKAENYQFEDDLEEQPIVSEGTWWQTLQDWIVGD